MNTVFFRKLLNFLKKESFFAFLLYLVYITIAAIGAYLIIKDANWVFGDDHEYLVSTAVGKKMPLSRHIIPQLGRFNPLSGYDYNILAFFPFGRDALAHYILVALSFMIFIYFYAKISYLINKNYANSLKTGALFSMASLSCFLCNAHLVRVFCEVIFPERLLLIVLSGFVYFYLSALQNDSKWRYLTSFICAVYATYLKEPVSGSLVVLALVNLIFSYKKLSNIQKIFYWSLIVNFIVFIILYLILVYKNVSSFYNSGIVGLSYIQMVKGIFIQNMFLIVLFVLALIRGVKILFFKDRKHLVFDALLFMAVSYVCAYIFLKLNSGYYFLPAILLGLIVILYWMCCLQSLKLYSAFLCVSCLLLIYRNYGTALMQYKNIINERNEFMPTIAKIADFYHENNFKFFDDTLGEIHSHNDEVIHWQQVVLNVATNYKLGSENIQYYQLVNNTHNLTNRDVIFYSNFNKDKQNKKDIDCYLLENNFNKILEKWGLSVYRVTTVKEVQNSFFEFNKDIQDVILAGLSGIENWGRWSDGNKVTIKFKASKPIKVRFDTIAFLNTKCPQQNIRIFVNNKEKGRWHFAIDEANPDIEFTIDKNELSYNGWVRIDFEIENPQSPKELGLSEDVRKLAIGFISMKTEELQ